MRPVPTWPAFTTTVGFDVQERPPLQTLQAGLSSDGDRANFPNDKEKGLSVVRLQSVKAY